MDAVLLSGFAKVKPGERALDLGTGTGIIPILLEAKTKGEHFTGLEIQPESADMAARSVAYNHLEGKNYDCDRRYRGRLVQQLRSSSSNLGFRSMFLKTSQRMTLQLAEALYRLLLMLRRSRLITAELPAMQKSCLLPALACKYPENEKTGLYSTISYGLLIPDFMVRRQFSFGLHIKVFRRDGPLTAK